MEYPTDPGAMGFTSPGGTIPFPLPNGKFRPVGYWAPEPSLIGWQSTGTAQAPRTEGSWPSVLFDLRPDCITADTKRNNSLRMNRGSGAQLFVAISGLTSSSHFGMEVYSRILGHPTDAARVQRVTADVNVTADVAIGVDAVVLSALPFSGYPMRFWQWVLIFRFGVVVPATLPVIAVQGGMY